MRPGDFSPGNLNDVLIDRAWSLVASMRPGDFSPGNTPTLTSDGRVQSLLQ